jgi:hypothetical protein
MDEQWQQTMTAARRTTCCLLGAARLLSENTDAWHGTHIALFQPGRHEVERVPRGRTPGSPGTTELRQLGRVTIAKASPAAS